MSTIMCTRSQENRDRAPLAFTQLCGVKAPLIERRIGQISKAQKATRELHDRIKRAMRFLVTIVANRVNPPEQRIGNFSRGGEGLLGPPEFDQVVSLNFEQACFYVCGSAQPPQQTRQPQYQFALDRRLSIVVGNDRGFEP